MLHVLPGAAFLVLAPFQFSRRIRARHIRFHRWSGRALVLTGFVSTAAGLFFGLTMPYGGAGEVTAVTLFGAIFVGALGRGWVAVRRGDVARHREWMIRAFAVALGISTVRLVSAILDYALTPAGLAPPDLFALSLWTGWVLSLGAAEIGIRITRARPAAAATAAI